MKQVTDVRNQLREICVSLKLSFNGTQTDMSTAIRYDWSWHAGIMICCQVCHSRDNMSRFSSNLKSNEDTFAYVISSITYRVNVFLFMQQCVWTYWTFVVNVNMYCFSCKNLTDLESRVVVCYRKCLCSGFFMNAAERISEGDYVTVGND